MGKFTYLATGGVPLTVRRSIDIGLRLAAIDLIIDLSFIAIGLLFRDMIWLERAWFMIWFGTWAKKLGMYMWAGHKAAIPEAHWGTKARHGALACATLAGSLAAVCLLAGYALGLHLEWNSRWSVLEWYFVMNGLFYLISVPIGAPLGALTAALRRD